MSSSNEYNPFARPGRVINLEGLEAIGKKFSVGGMTPTRTHALDDLRTEEIRAQKAVLEAIAEYAEEMAKAEDPETSKADAAKATARAEQARLRSDELHQIQVHSICRQVETLLIGGPEAGVGEHLFDAYKADDEAVHLGVLQNLVQVVLAENGLAEALPND